MKPFFRALGMGVGLFILGASFLLTPAHADKKEAGWYGKKKVTICHKPGKNAEKDLSVPISALKGHLKHGDYEGKCDSDGKKKVTICHKLGTKAEKDLSVSASALKGHIKHGDYEGKCNIDVENDE